MMRQTRRPERRTMLAAAPRNSDSRNCSNTTTRTTTRLSSGGLGSRSGSTLYPQHPPDCHVLVRVPETDLTAWDRFLVGASSLFIVGSVLWVPAMLVYTYRRWKRIPPQQKKRRALYASLILAAIGLLMFGPHRHPKVGKWMRVRQWRLWKAWLRFIAFEVIADIQPDRFVNATTSSTASSTLSTTGTPPTTTATATSSSSVADILYKIRHDPSILFAFVPHGIFPFGIAFGVLPEVAQRAAFGFFRPVAATATQFFPIVRDLLKWMEVIDASRSNVQRALSSSTASSSSSGQGDNDDFRRRIGLVPGGIAEIFQGYPKPNTHPDEEYAIVRKGFLRMALQHNIAVVPVYCFGATKMMRRLQLPTIVEHLSNLYRVSICIFYGVCGLPIPYRQRLLYVMGNPIVPPPSAAVSIKDDAAVDEMHKQFCDELHRLFDRHKEAYGWGHKSLQLISR